MIKKNTLDFSVMQREIQIETYARSCTITQGETGPTGPQGLQGAQHLLESCDLSNREKPFRLYNHFNVNNE